MLHHHVTSASLKDYIKEKKNNNYKIHMLLLNDWEKEVISNNSPFVYWDNGKSFLDPEKWEALYLGKTKQI